MGNLSHDDLQFDYQPISPLLTHVLGALLSIITMVAIVFNGLIILIYSRSSGRKKKLFILNLAVSELLCPLLNYWMVLSSSYQGRWLYGKLGCELYAFSTGFFSMTSIGSLAAMAFERYTVCHYFTHRHLRIKTKYYMIISTWIYGFVLTFPPLCGWGRYVLDIYRPSCTYDYYSHDLNSQTFMAFLVVGGFFLPALIIIFCYVSMFKMILSNEKTMEHLALRPSVKSHSSNHSNKEEAKPKLHQCSSLMSPELLVSGRRHSSALAVPPSAMSVPLTHRHSLSLNDMLFHGPQQHCDAILALAAASELPPASTIPKILSWSGQRNMSRTEIQFVKLTLMVISAFFICWTPYAILTILCQFRVNAAFSPTAAAITLLFAKSSVALNPIIYAFKEKKFRLEVTSLLSMIAGKLRASLYSFVQLILH